MKKDLITLNDINREEVLALFEKTALLKKKRNQGEPHRSLEGKSLGMIFSKESTRTRISFEVGMYELGGQAIFLSSDQLQIKREETAADSAKVLSRYLHGVLIRTHEHEFLEEFAKHATIPVINGLTDLNHPVQILTDIFTIKEKLDRIEKVKVAYIGDGNNVAYSWILGANLMDMHLTIASPTDLRPEIPKTLNGGGRLDLFEDPLKAAEDADVIYTDVWVSMGDKNAAEKKERLKNYQINQNVLKAAKPNALVMHCLPAHRGEEIASEVLDGPQSIIFDQAENRLHVQKAILDTLLQQ
jgi:ornithine carbamoyltransferase